ncbi:hypothetical protein COCMIDRAFT_82763 [Bipolaris oryzae ATCC 44560]|uniref:DNA replication regulator Sld3 C-terminal domain-containing protein n=1 Tax=Bipolaris oryzae ATCC 44560 TaxID=930090 RepID=W6ZRT3_COCMI|nr:uncharacterized protein COCMIDRAFT_82763 [Bipolaris oryzae ATCC 44560]EUC50199.1 hypothetical protein COCMIDRAFT_82763 [Bipolaris oryzae ATCC 44560]
MSAYALQTKTMLQPVPDTQTQLLRLATKHEEPKPQLPSKLTRDSLCGLGAFNKPFTIRPYSGSPHAKTVTFKPIRVVGRSQLPLTFLDTSTDDDFAPNSLFAAHVDILEQDELEKEEDRVLRVLIAQLETKKSLYAIERVKARIYSICKLANWLKEKDVADLWDPANLHQLPIRTRVDTSTSTSGEWWQHAAVETQAVEPLIGRTRMGMLRPKPPQVPAAMDVQQLQGMAAPQGMDSLDSVPTESLLEPPAPLPPQEQLDLLVQQYLDAVYMSKTSLAYFAKGPLTRIRNAFTLAEEGAPPTHDLVESLRAMLLSPKASEKKYYGKLPSFIRAMVPGTYSDDETMAGASKAKKSKKKAKLSRDGVYPQEEVLVKRWWQSELPSGDAMATETMDQRIKRRIGDLRVRETLAQLILMLEIIALEAMSTSKAGGQQLTKEETQDQSEQSAPKKRKKKLDDINVQLDLALDKLCIWHATEELGILDFDAKPSQQNEDVDGTGRNGSSDRLHSFCVEVIIPFYINRLPEQALMVNKKLGGPAHSLPAKRKANKPPLSSRRSRDSKEPDTKKSRRSLARVATDNTGRIAERTTPSLGRSATDSVLVEGVKREASETPLSAIPFRRSPSKGARQSMSQIRHLQGRQIDLAEPSAAASAKMKQKQRVEEDLQEAILALKRPNRGLAAGGYVAEKEQRGVGQPSKSRKPTVTVRKTIKDVQVTATPRVSRRTKNMVEQTPVQQHYDPFVRSPGEEAPHSSGFCVPSSGVRPRPGIVAARDQGHATASSLGRSSIAETPSKAPAGKTFSSDAVRRRIFATPAKAAEPNAQGRRDEGALHIFETPAKGVVGMSLPEETKAAPVGATTTPSKSVSRPASEGRPVPFLVRGRDDASEPSIYDELGWNDDDDDDDNGFV